MNRAENGDVKRTFDGYGDLMGYSADVKHNECLSVGINNVAKTATDRGHNNRNPLSGENQRLNNFSRTRIVTDETLMETQALCAQQV